MMRTRVLGRTGLDVSVVALGAGPVPALMTGDDATAQRALLARAVEVGINWIDTAAGYGNGQSEASLGRAIRELGIADRVHVATKVRLTVEDLRDPAEAVRRSLAGSLQRLGLSGVTLVQLHNGITATRGEIAASLTPTDVLELALPALQSACDDGLAQWIGLTGTGTPGPLAEVIASGGFDTVQIPHHVLSPADPVVLQACRDHDVGVFAIRVYAGGALTGRPPSAHTLTTPYFPLALYEADQLRASRLQESIGDSMLLPELALRFALSDAVALVGLATPAEVDAAAEWAERGPLSAEWQRKCEVNRT